MSIDESFMQEGWMVFIYKKKYRFYILIFRNKLPLLEKMQQKISYVSSFSISYKYYAKAEQTVGHSHLTMPQEIFENNLC